MEQKHQFETVEQFLKSVGRPRFRDEVGLTNQGLTRAVGDNVFPSSWFMDIKAWCDKEGVDVPVHLFKWADLKNKLGHNTKQNVYSPADAQV